MRAFKAASRALLGLWLGVSPALAAGINAGGNGPIGRASTPAPQIPAPPGSALGQDSSLRAQNDIRAPGQVLPELALPVAGPPESLPVPIPIAAADAVFAQGVPESVLPRALEDPLFLGGVFVGRDPGASPEESVFSALAGDAAGVERSLRVDSGGLAAAAEFRVLYDGAGALGPGAEAVDALFAADFHAAGLVPPGGRPGAGRPEPAPPRSSLLRSFEVGMLAFALDTALSVGIRLTAAWAGYVPHSNYVGPLARLGPDPSAESVWAMALSAVAGAPVAEELMMRGMLMGGLSLLAAKIRQGPWAVFWAPALVSSLAFVALHETADPVAFGIRLIQAMILARVFYKEGLAASMALHGINNFMAAAGTLSLLLLGLDQGMRFAGLALLSATAFALFSAVHLWKEREARGSGEVVPYRFARRELFFLAWVAILGGALTGIYGLSVLAPWLWPATGAAVLAYLWHSRRRQPSGTFLPTAMNGDEISR